MTEQKRLPAEATAALRDLQEVQRGTDKRIVAITARIEAAKQSRRPTDANAWIVEAGNTRRRLSKAKGSLQKASVALQTLQEQKAEVERKIVEHEELMHRRGCCRRVAGLIAQYHK